MTASERVEYDGEVLRLGEALGEDDLRRAWAEGRDLSSDEAVTLALSD